MYFYNTELGYTIVGAWGLRKLVTGYSGPIVRIRDTTGGAEQDVYANSTTGELNTYTVTGNAALTTIYDQSGNGCDLVQATTTLQPLLILNATGNGKPVARFDGSDDYMRDGTASTSRAYMVAAPVHVSMSAPRTPREQYGRVWNIPHDNGANATPYFRVGVGQENTSAIDWVCEARVNGTQTPNLKLFGANNRKGFWAHALVPYIGKFIQAGVSSQNVTTDTAITYPNSTRFTLGANGLDTENNGMDWVEHVVYSTTSPVEADIQALVNKVSFERLFGANRFFKFEITGSFSPTQTDAGLAELELRTSVGGSDTSDQYTPMIGERCYNATESWEKIFDNSGSTWYSSGNSPATAPILYFAADQNSLLAELKITARNDTFEEYTVKKYKIYRWTQTGWEQSDSEIDNTAAGCVAGQTYTNAITWPITYATGTYGFSFDVAHAAAIGSFGFAYDVIADAAVGFYGFAYDVQGPITITYGFSYSIELRSLFGFSYRILEDEGDLLGYKHIDPATGGMTLRSVIVDRIATVIDPTSFANPGALTYPDVITQAPVDSAIHDGFYGDYYNRIWVSPEDLRLSNPKIGFHYEIGVWNAYDRPNEMIDYIGTDVDDVEFVEEGDLPISFGPIEYKTMHFLINEEAPSQIDGNLFFEFTMGGDGFDLFALVLGILRTLPNEPFNEVWSWFTVIETSRDGTEQRQGFRDQPRIRASYNVQILDEEDRQTAYQQLYSFATRSVIVPFMQYTTPLDADAALGDTRLYFDLEASDVRAGEYVVIFSPSTEQYVLAQISTLNADGVNLVTPLTFDIDSETWEVLPGRSMRLPDRSSLGMGAVNGTMSFRGEGTEWHEIVRPSGEVTLEEFDGYPVLPYKPIAQSDIEEAFSSDVEVLDNDVAPPKQRSSFTNPFVESTKAWQIDRETEMDWWRTFLDYCSGMLKPFLLPTWREDLPLYAAPEVGDNKFITTNMDYSDYFPHATYQYVQIQSDAGVIYRKVESIEVLPEGLRLSLDDTIGVSVGSNVNMVVSYLNLTRLNDDDVDLDHYVNWTIVSLDVRTVNG